MRRSAVLLAACLLLALAPASHAQVFWAELSGLAEDPPNASPGYGTAIVTLDLAAHTLRVQAWFADLVGNTTAAHIHGPTAQPETGVAGVITQVPSFVGFPLGVTSGSFDATYDTLDIATYRAAFVTANGGTAAGAEAALAAALLDRKAYLNIHTTQYPGGEIRGFLVPEPGSLAFLGAVIGGAGILVLRRRRRR